MFGGGGGGRLFAFLFSLNCLRHTVTKNVLEGRVERKGIEVGQERGNVQFRTFRNDASLI
jgi:hypothetical protein